MRIQTKERETPAWEETETESTEAVINTAGTGRTPQCQGQLRAFMAALTVNPLCISLNIFSHKKKKKKVFHLSIKKHNCSCSKTWTRTKAQGFNNFNLKHVCCGAKTFSPGRILYPVRLRSRGQRPAVLGPVTVSAHQEVVVVKRPTTRCKQRSGAADTHRHKDAEL